MSKRRKMARPKKHILEKHGHQMTIRFTESQYNCIVENAKSLKLAPAEYVRLQAIAGKIEMDVRIVADIEELHEIARLLANATGNLNQIAKYYNLGGIRSKEMQKRINAGVEAIFEIRNMMTKIVEEGYGRTETHSKQEF
jgi:hypothetical protein